MIFHTEYNHPGTIPMPETSRIEKVYQERLDKDGKKYLKEVDVVDVYEKIQAAKEGVTLANLLDKYKLKINESNLTKIEDTIVDLTNLPESLTETMNVIDNARLIYDATPIEIKKVFNNNFTEFLAGAQNGTLQSLINTISKKQTQQVVESVVEQVVQPVQPVQTTPVQPVQNQQIYQNNMQGVNINA